MMKPKKKAIFYWEMDDKWRARHHGRGDWIQETFSPDVAETVLLMEINHGRTLLGIEQDWDL